MCTPSGLAEVEKMCEDGWTYCGSREKGCYLKESIPYIPDHEPYCICGHPIEYNYFIMNPEKTKVVVVGSKCIEQFTNGLLKTCELCRAPHRNIAYDLCNEHKNAIIAAEKSKNRIAKQVKKAMNKLLPKIEDKIDDGIEYYLSQPIYLNVPFKEKELCKLYGCKWSKKHSMWYCSEGCIPRIVREQVKWCQPSFKFIHVQYLDYVYE